MSEVVTMLADPEQALPPAMWWWIVGCLAIFGASIGSFLNVVIHRLPAGESIVHPGSRCPACGHPIRAYDNIPVLSWLLLRGRCRDCHAPISVRYPAIEALVAGMFVALGIRGVLNGGSHLPADFDGTAVGIDVRLWGVYVYHLVLLCTLLCLTMIQVDGATAPMRLVVSALFVGLVAPIFDSTFCPFALSGAMIRPTPFTDKLLTGVIGIVIGGVICALATAKKNQEPAMRHRQYDLVMASGLVGVYLGWQSVVLLNCISSMLYLVAMGIHRLRPWRWNCHVIWMVILTTAAFVYILCGSWLARGFPVLTTEADWRMLVVGCVMVTMVSRLTSLITRDENGGVAIE